MVSSTVGNRVIVVGSGIAGLVSARVLADRFEEVLVIDRDAIPDRPGTRDGLPQGKHLHALLSGGLNVLSELLPGLTDDLDALGARRGVGGLDLVFYRPEGKSYALAFYLPEPRPGTTAYFQTRGLLEHCVRSRIEGLPNVRSRYRALVREAIVERGAVRGVVLDGGERVEADLVVDASGRASRTVGWLKLLGYAEPQESVVNCDFAYTSVFLSPTDPSALEGVGLFVLPPLEGPYMQRGAALMCMERGIWLLSLAGRFGDYPPGDIEGVLQYAKTLADPILFDLISTAEPLGEPARYKFPRSLRRHYERLERFPEGLLPIGDAICHFNPVYGQGMSAAIRQARALGQILAARAEAGRGLDGLAGEFFPVAYEETRAPWVMAAVVDFMNPQCTGDFPMEEMPSLEMLQFLFEAAQTDDEAWQLMLDVSQLDRPLSALLEPPWPERLAASRS